MPRIDLDEHFDRKPYYCPHYEAQVKLFFSMVSCIPLLLFAVLAAFTEELEPVWEFIDKVPPIVGIWLVFLGSGMAGIWWLRRYWKLKK